MCVRVCVCVCFVCVCVGGEGGRGDGPIRSRFLIFSVSACGHWLRTRLLNGGESWSAPEHRASALGRKHAAKKSYAMLKTQTLLKQYGAIRHSSVCLIRWYTDHVSRNPQVQLYWRFVEIEVLEKHRMWPLGLFVLAVERQIQVPEHITARWLHLDHLQ